MTKNPYAPKFEDLPETLPIFPLTGVLLLPHGQLPLNIFEPRYVAMIEDAMSNGNRLIGMIQPREGAQAQKPEIYTTGCAGKITEFAETTDGRFVISLNGVCRFKIKEELDTLTPYRLIKPDWDTFEDDMDEKTCLGIDREILEERLDQYFKKEGMSCDFNKFEAIDDGKLMTALAMVCPFEPREKQALLEEQSCVKRAEIFMTMLEMAIHGDKSVDQSGGSWH